MDKNGDAGPGNGIGHVLLRIPFIALGDAQQTIRLVAEKRHREPLQDFVPGTDAADEQEGDQVT